MSLQYALDVNGFLLEPVVAEDAVCKLIEQCGGLATACGWWKDPATGEPKERNMGEMLCLVHSEISEAMEGHRTDALDDKLPQFKQFDVELADAVIRIMDIADKHCADFGLVLATKLAYNAQRADHKPEHRVLAGGKKY